jgi:hypothetical protein
MVAIFAIFQQVVLWNGDKNILFLGKRGIKLTKKKKISGNILATISVSLISVYHISCLEQFMSVSSDTSVFAPKTKIFNQMFLAVFLDEILIRFEVVFLEILFHFHRVLFAYTTTSFAGLSKI